MFSALAKSPRITHGGFVAATAMFVLVASSCSGGDADVATESGANADIDTVASCLTDSGFGVQREADVDPARVVNDALKDAIGLDETLFLEGHDGGAGRGSIGFFTDAQSAAEELAAGASMRTDDVLAGQVGATTYDYIATSGESDGLAAAIEECLSE